VLDSALTNPEFDGVPVDAMSLGVAGHSLGGYTDLGLAGGWASWKEARVKAVLALSPYCSPFLSKGQLASMNIPVMYQGGTRDFGREELTTSHPSPDTMSNLTAQATSHGRI
jgi:predicted dienelactone hydrolase